MTPQSVEEYVDRQIRTWQEQSRSIDREQIRLPGHVWGPVIAVSREHGALGARIARLVAQKLEFAYYDREIVERIASTANVRKAVVESVDERVQGRFADWVTDVFGGRRMSGNDYVRHLSTVLMTIAYHGRAVIVGRGACFLLNPLTTLRVRAYAPIEIRVARVAESHGLSPEEARADILKMDAGRIDFGRRHFDIETSDPRWYDLMLDTSTLSSEACARMIEMAFLARFADRVATP
jgi:cytidylate kinase